MVDVNRLIKLSKDAMKNAYCVHSDFPVGASLLTEDGTIFLGCNVENSSYGLTICAERTAIVKAVSEGHSKFRAIAVSTKVDEYLYPCGACRQFLSEFANTKMEVICSKPDSTYIIKTLEELLPGHFTLKPKNCQLEK